MVDSYSPVTQANFSSEKAKDKYAPESEYEYNDLRSPHWYVIYTKSRHEQKVTDRLAQLGGDSVDLFLPLIDARSRRKDRQKKISLPLFPGYIFIHCLLDRYFYLDIVNTSGVVNILGYGWPRLIPLPEVQIESLKTLLKAKAPISYYPYIREGDRVRVIDGPLEGAEGILSKIDYKKARLIISLDILHRSVATEIDFYSVERC
jgi:transcription antitermination factor NusG